ncbi:MAG TPA: long-chain fatty acid--CoA ligase [Polyangiaceae bacterium]|jgi:long-chain acyl-CoA synthetase|nr:long-chain fatty acid--CoA ligase [Polyangiaceae bacterium]
MSLSPWTEKCRSAREPKERETLADVLRPAMVIAPDKVAIYFEDRGITYRELDSRADSIATALVALGIQKGDRVAVHLDNRPEFVEIYQGVMRAGAILVPTNVMYTADEMEHIVSDSGAVIAFMRGDLVEKLSARRERFPALREIIAVGPSSAGVKDFAALTATPGARPTVAIEPDAIAFIQYTSGTTGKPKGAMVSHGNVLAVIDSMGDLANVPSIEEDVMLLVLQLFHAYALNLAMNRAFLGITPFVLVTRFDAERVIRLIEQHHVTMFYGAPPMYFALVNSPEVGKTNLSSLRMSFSGAAPLPVVILERFKQLTGVEIVEGYGLSETAPTLCSNAAGVVNKPGTVGPAIPGVTIRLVDDEDRDVAPGEVGEIIAKGPNVFKGYWNRPTETAEAMRGGWFHTGDLARIDADGYYTIVDRKKDMVLVSGYNVYPIEVENVILRHPKVLDAAVIGIPDDYQGESVKAFVVLRPGESMEPKELTLYCREHLAAYKVPRHVEFREDLPKSVTGKLLKRELRASERPGG